MRFILSPNTAAARSLYAVMHSSTSISSRPSIMASSLDAHISKCLLEIRSSYPPVLVPPMRSNISHGLTGESSDCFRSWFRRSMMFFNMYRVERPRTPPPSKDNRHSHDLSRRFGSPPCLLDMVCPIARLMLRVVLVVQKCSSFVRRVKALKR